jgi:hypothetical protein
MHSTVKVCESRTKGTEPHQSAAALVSLLKKEIMGRIEQFGGLGVFTSTDFGDIYFISKSKIQEISKDVK